MSESHGVEGLYAKHRAVIEVANDPNWWDGNYVADDENPQCAINIGIEYDDGVKITHLDTYMSPEKARAVALSLIAAADALDLGSVDSDPQIA